MMHMRPREVFDYFLQAWLQHQPKISEDATLYLLDMGMRDIKVFEASTPITDEF